MTGKQAWAVIFGLVVFHEVVCDDGQLLSEEVDRALEKHPVLVYLFTLVTVAHLLNWLHPRVDPYVSLGALFSKMKGVTK
ncbi:hypothetical protein IU440_28745 [Nocardia cyriacigeorgica]|uniref:DUF7427 family protein n=1 Tax=Nocardia cyriacigeorgica TaxID=135487 RepID=UPI0018938C11|nr:hypothetical protein [Nocardia cyriacigeorgica]MBF6428668.1 hypothetical protein [Nocardia cyriacigeorgica]